MLRTALCSEPLYALPRFILRLALYSARRKRTILLFAFAFCTYGFFPEKTGDIHITRFPVILLIMKTYDRNGYTYINKRNKTFSVSYRSPSGRAKKYTAAAAGLILIIVVAVFISGAAVKEREILFPEKSFYAVQIGAYTTAETARTVSDVIIRMGGAGVVIPDENYRVIAAFYVTEEEALSVTDKLKSNGMNASVYETLLSECRSKAECSLSEKNLVENSMKTLIGSIEEMLDLSILFDKGDYNKSEASHILNETAEDIEENIGKLSKLDFQPANSVRYLLSSCAELLSETASDLTGGNIKSALAQCIVNLWELYNTFSD